MCATKHTVVKYFIDEEYYFDLNKSKDNLQSCFCYHTQNDYPQKHKTSNNVPKSGWPINITPKVHHRLIQEDTKEN